VSSTRFETEGSSSGRRWYIQSWYEMLQYGNRIEHTVLPTILLILMHVKRAIP